MSHIAAQHILQNNQAIHQNDKHNRREERKKDRVREKER